MVTRIVEGGVIPVRLQVGECGANRAIVESKFIIVYKYLVQNHGERWLSKARSKMWIQQAGITRLLVASFHRRGLEGLVEIAIMEQHLYCLGQSHNK